MVLEETDAEMKGRRVVAAGSQAVLAGIAGLELPGRRRSRADAFDGAAGDGAFTPGEVEQLAFEAGGAEVQDDDLVGRGLFIPGIWRRRP